MPTKKPENTDLQKLVQQIENENDPGKIEDLVDKLCLDLDEQDQKLRRKRDEPDEA